MTTIFKPTQHPVLLNEVATTVADWGVRATIEALKEIVQREAARAAEEGDKELQDEANWLINKLEPLCQHRYYNF